MVRMAYTPNPTISMSKEARGCLNATTKVPRGLPVEAEYGSGLHRVDAKAEVKTAPAHIETGSVAMSLHEMVFPSRTAFAQVPKIGERDGT